ncbi:MAG: CRISPR-associated endoribonuclease Cas6 [Candidatus Sericytochromatia bacterium]|nr:CRISPR-associated endoribonuclease Cas6 [Candidatus Sericytochromatia bacterium]
MPYAIVMELYSDKEISQNNLTSRILNALTLDIVKSSDPNLSQYFHDEEFNKSMTLRKLYYKNNLLTLRLTLLDEKLFERFGNIMLNACTQSYDLNGTALKIAKISCTKQSKQFWADHITYQEIFNNASKTDNIFNFNIVTPLSFKRNDSFLAFPLSDLFFKSLHKKWNKHSGLPFDDIFCEMIEKDVFISYYDLKTEQVKDNMKIAFTGCVGNVRFKVSTKASERFIHYLNVLSDYSYFACVGAKTGMGMGQVYRTHTSVPSQEGMKRKEVESEI